MLFFIVNRMADSNVDLFFFCMVDLVIFLYVYLCVYVCIFYVCKLAKLFDALLCTLIAR